MEQISSPLAGNPFEEDGGDIIILDTIEVVSERVARSIMCAHKVIRLDETTFVAVATGETTALNICKECLESQVLSFIDPIKLNKISLPSNQN